MKQYTTINAVMQRVILYDLCVLYKISLIDILFNHPLLMNNSA